MDWTFFKYSFRKRVIIAFISTVAAGIVLYPLMSMPFFRPRPYNAVWLVGPPILISIILFRTTMSKILFSLALLPTYVAFGLLSFFYIFHLDY